MPSWVRPVLTALASHFAQLAGFALMPGPALVMASLVLTTDR